MSDLLIETICIRNGKVQNISAHNQRCHQARAAVFGRGRKINLRSYIDNDKAIWPVTKCRITYGHQVADVTYEPYLMKDIASLRLVDIGDYTYGHKYQDRSQLAAFYSQRQTSDDILMVKDGLITDSYYANVALRKHSKWYTPKKPLLEGTMRAKLLAKGKIEVRDIYAKKLHTYERVRLFNAMIPFGKIEFETSSISE